MRAQFADGGDERVRIRGEIEDHPLGCGIDGNPPNGPQSFLDETFGGDLRTLQLTSAAMQVVKKEERGT